MISEIKKVYLDNAAATPLDSAVLQAMMPYLTDDYKNPSALYISARTTHEAVNSARSLCARLLGVHPNSILFTSSGTESDNIAIKSVMDAYPESSLIVSSIEHEAVLKPAEKYKHSIAAVNAKGYVGVPALLDQVSDSTVLVSVMLANNEIGTIQPIKEIALGLKKIKDSRRKSGNSLPLFLHTDACQAPSYISINAPQLGVDLMTLNSSKVYGPKGVGLLYHASHVRLAPLLQGGSQEFGLRAGTENVAGIIGFSTALELACSLRPQEVKRLQDIQKKFFSAISSNTQFSINGGLKQRLPNNIHLTIENQDNERLVFALDELGFEVSVGSACSASSDEPSHVLSAIGLSTSQARSSIRITMGRHTNQNDMDRLVVALRNLVSN